MGQRSEAADVAADLGTGPGTRRPAWGWVALAGGLSLGSILAFGLQQHSVLTGGNLWPRLDWQPSQIAAQPWRAWSAACVHLSELHLAANLAGALLVAALGWVAQVPARCVIAWLVAWPLVQLGLLAQPEVQHYGGLSGVLHAGVAVVAVHLLWSPAQTQRRIGAAILAGLLLKLLTETPWAGAVSHPPGWDIAVAPGAHVSGVVAGSITAMLAQALHAGHNALREALGAIDAHD